MRGDFLLLILIGAYMGGILLQGAGVMISVVMLRSPDFSKVTAYAGLLGNGFDLTQHVIHPFAPAVSDLITPLMGVFYLVWFPMLARDLLRLGGVSLRLRRVDYAGWRKIPTAGVGVVNAGARAGPACE